MPDDIPYGYCHCGCGQRTALSKQSRSDRGTVRGEPVRYRPGHNPSKADDAEARFWAKINTGAPNGCWEWTAGISRGYGVFQAGRSIRAHRFAYELLVGPIPAGKQLDHVCRNRRCVNPAHLEPVTCAENIRRGRRTKLCAQDVEEIRLSSESRQVLASRYGVSPYTITDIRGGKSWSAG